jgi:hypothetical protein
MRRGMKFIGTGLILAGSMMLTGVSHAADIK